jgi:hypothetical protein
MKALDGGEVGEEADFPDSSVADTPGCAIKSLPKRLLVKAAREAVRLNPVNAPAMALGSAMGMDVSDPLSIAVLTQKYWGPVPRKLTVSFMESTPNDVKKRIVSHLNAWSQTGCISFVQTNGTGQVRISRGATGHWSYLGTDVLLIPQNRATMNLQHFSMSTPESEYRRVVRHEAGHTLGFPHEHMRKQLVNRIDRQKAYQYFWATQGWNQAMVDAQVLTSLDERSIFGTPSDQTSIMCYQLPASITKDGKPILGGKDINNTDFKFVGTIYPRGGSSFSPGMADDVESNFDSEDDWPEEEDV